MRLSFGLEQKLQQKQILAPRMIQSMEILQLPIQALQERIEQELSDNPLLETVQFDDDMPEEPIDRIDPNAPAEDERELVVGDDQNNEDDFERLLNMNDEWPDTFEERSRPSSTRREEEQDWRHDALSNLAARSESLQDHLEQQLYEWDLDERLHDMAVRIISSLDSNGYLTAPLRDLLPPDADGQALALAEQALRVVRQLEPAGVGARDLRDCLLLQLTPEMPYYEEVKQLIEHHLDDLKDNRMPVIQRKTGYSIERIQAAWAELRKLNPKPGAEYSETPVPTVTPDLFVERDEQGRYRILLEERDLPQLQISNYYRQRLISGQATTEEKEFIKRKINSAQWLIDSIQQRRSTLQRVAQAVVDYQRAFFEQGPEAILPLKMQQIADEVGVHVTTVSRAVDDKWMQTPRGILPLRKFFVGGTKSEEGEDVAWDKIRIKLQEVIDGEDKSKPYSDDDLVQKLAEHGLTVARRTITKYRKKMNIPSSRQRKDWTTEEK